MKLVASMWITCGIVFFGGCDSANKDSTQIKSESTNTYENWETFTYETVKIHHPPNFVRKDSLTIDAQYYSAVLRRNCLFFDIPVPADTLEIFYYTGYGQGREMTGQEYPFATDSAIHFWLPSYPGVTLMQWLIPKWVPGEPRHQFLKHGLITLLDYSGWNYHFSTMVLVDHDTLIHLAELALDTATNSNTERYQSSEAASFVDFVASYYGIKALEVLYRAPTPFNEAVPGIFMMPIDSLQRRWLDFAREQGRVWQKQNPEQAENYISQFSGS